MLRMLHAVRAPANHSTSPACSTSSGDTACSVPSPARSMAARKALGSWRRPERATVRPASARVTRMPMKNSVWARTCGQAAFRDAQVVGQAEAAGLRAPWVPACAGGCWQGPGPQRWAGPGARPGLQGPATEPPTHPPTHLAALGDVGEGVVDGAGGPELGGHVQQQVVACLRVRGSSVRRRGVSAPGGGPAGCCAMPCCCEPAQQPPAAIDGGPHPTRQLHASPTRLAHPLPPAPPLALSTSSPMWGPVQLSGMPAGRWRARSGSGSASASARSCPAGQPPLAHGREDSSLGVGCGAAHHTPLTDRLQGATHRRA